MCECVICHYLCLYQVLGHDREHEDRYVLQSSAFAQMHRSHLTTKLFMPVFCLCSVVACMYACITYAHVEFESHVSQVLALCMNVLPCVKNIYRYMFLLGSIMHTLMTALNSWTLL